MSKMKNKNKEMKIVTISISQKKDQIKLNLDLIINNLVITHFLKILLGVFFDKLKCELVVNR